jgi:hypothetical protein
LWAELLYNFFLESIILVILMLSIGAQDWQYL